MPEQDVSDRLAAIQRYEFGEFGDAFGRGEYVAAADYDQLAQALSDHRQIALSYEAQIQAQDQQIGALRAEQARLRAALTALAQSWRDDYEKCGHDYEMVCMPQCAKELDALMVERPAENERLTAGWQPIETAPKQRIVLLFAVTDTAPDGTVRNWKMATGDWHHAYESERVVWTWGGRELKAYDHQPSHWMPLPEAPST